MSQGEILKPREDGTRKAVELSKALSVQEIPNTRLQNCPVNHLCTREQQVEKLTEANMPMPWKKTTNAIRKIRNCTALGRINEHIFGTIKDNGVTITLI
jgi:hypothetical protein